MQERFGMPEVDAGAIWNASQECLKRFRSNLECGVLKWNVECGAKWNDDADAGVDAGAIWNASQECLKRFRSNLECGVLKLEGKQYQWVFTICTVHTKY